MVPTYGLLSHWVELSWKECWIRHILDTKWPLEILFSSLIIVYKYQNTSHRIRFSLHTAMHWSTFTPIFMLIRLLLKFFHNQSHFLSFIEALLIKEMMGLKGFSLLPDMIYSYCVFFLRNLFSRSLFSRQSQSFRPYSSRVNDTLYF